MRLVRLLGRDVADVGDPADIADIPETSDIDDIGDTADANDTAPRMRHAIKGVIDACTMAVAMGVATSVLIDEYKRIVAATQRKATARHTYTRTHKVQYVFAPHTNGDGRCRCVRTTVVNECQLRVM